MKTSPRILTLLTTFTLLPLSAQDGDSGGFRFVPPVQEAQEVVPAAPAPETPAPATGPTRVRIRPNTAQAAQMAPEESAAVRVALEGGGYVAPGRNVIRSGMPIFVRVLVQGREEISTEPQRVNESGRIALPLIQNVQVANLSLEEIEARLTEMYAEYFRSPHVIVQFVGATDDPYISPWGYVTLMGNVGRAGPVAIPPTLNMTVSGAIKYAGGTSSSANEASILVFRPNPEDQSVERIPVDLRNLGRRGNHENDIIVRAGDVIFVPERIF